MRIVLPAIAAVLVVLAAALSSARAETMLEERESLYNNIYVTERAGNIVMSFGRNKRYFTESVYDPTDDLALPVVYTRYMTAALAYAPHAARIAEIGFGGGRTIWYLHKHLPDATLLSVELDADVVDLAKKYFGIREGGNFSIAVKDGRLFLANGTERYDVILVDAYRGSFVPFHLLTREFYEAAKARLAPNGVLAQNIEPTTMLFEAAVLTLKAVFENIDLYEAQGNVVAIAYGGERKSQAELKAAARALDDRYGLKYPLRRMVDNRQVLTRLPQGDVLTDDFAPVETLKAVDRHNTAIGDYTERPDQ